MRSAAVVAAGHRAAATMARTLPVLLQGLARRMLVPLPWLHRLPTPANRRFTQATAGLDAAIAEVISLYRRSGVEQGDMLSQLVNGTDDSDSHLTDGQVRDQIMSLPAAGIETTATLLTWACHNQHAHTLSSYTNTESA
ncbi:cytochrome P450 [Nonomuraea sp. NPDC046802]|uniref:cytochrome P450 n=1 Tax=Nonomuraea sp. NPDC046802 TaxID=3154919 RepID=UPI00340F3F16